MTNTAIKLAKALQAQGAQLRGDGLVSLEQFPKAKEILILEETKEFLMVLSDRTGLPVDALLDGTWAHPYIALEVARQSSPELKYRLYNFILYGSGSSEPNTGATKAVVGLDPKPLV